MSALENPIWNSLTTRHSKIALGQASARRYPPQVTPLVAVEDSSESSARDLLELVETGERVGVLGVLPPDSDDWIVDDQISAHQYVWDNPRDETEPDAGALPLTLDQVPNMLELTALVYPAYFREETAALGPYFGILLGDHLCAMAGIRMAMDGYQEISAVCTHPDHRGQGLAGRLTRHLIYHIQSEGDVPFLHTESDNIAANHLYAKLGFALRKALPFRIMTRSFR